MLAGRGLAHGSPASSSGVDQQRYEHLVQSAEAGVAAEPSAVDEHGLGCARATQARLRHRAVAASISTALLLVVVPLVAHRGAFSSGRAPVELQRGDRVAGSIQQWSAPPACSARFVAPAPPRTATQHNGVALPDVCLEPSAPDGSIHVFVIGDWGGVYSEKGLQPADDRSKSFGSKHRQFVLGADDKAQQRVAEQMAERAKHSNPDYIINVGDNYYWGGVGTTNDESYYGFGEGFKCGATPPIVQKPSRQWQLIFEDVYKGPGIDGKPWLGVLGNHDYGGWKFTGAWDQAIGYTWTSARWMTPAQYWRVTVRYPGFSVDWFFIDTNYINAHPPGGNNIHNICSRRHNEEGASCSATGPQSVDECVEWFEKLKDAELAWLEDGLRRSTSTWQILVTHFPPDLFADTAAHFAALYGIDLFITGHVHKQMVIGENEQAFLNGCPIVVSGGGGGITAEGLPDAAGQDDMYGFVDMTISAWEITMEAISHGGVVRSTKVIHPRH